MMFVIVIYTVYIVTLMQGVMFHIYVMFKVCLCMHIHYIYIMSCYLASIGTSFAIQHHKNCINICSCHLLNFLLTQLQNLEFKSMSGKCQGSDTSASSQHSLDIFEITRVLGCLLFGIFYHELTNK